MYVLYSLYVAEQNIWCITQCSQGVDILNKFYIFTHMKFYLFRNAGTNKFFKIQYWQDIENVKYMKLSRKEQFLRKRPTQF